MMRPPDGRIGRDRDEPAKESYALHIKRVAINVEFVILDVHDIIR